MLEGNSKLLPRKERNRKNKADFEGFSKDQVKTFLEDDDSELFGGSEKHHAKTEADAGANNRGDGGGDAAVPADDDVDGAAHKDADDVRPSSSNNSTGAGAGTDGTAGTTEMVVVASSDSGTVESSGLRNRKGSSVAPALLDRLPTPVGQRGKNNAALAAAAASESAGGVCPRGLRGKCLKITEKIVKMYLPPPLVLVFVGCAIFATQCPLVRWAFPWLCLRSRLVACLNTKSCCESARCVCACAAQL
jgi:hypothetical protein